MNIISSQPNSEKALMDNIYMLCDAGASVIQLRTREPIRAAMVLRKSILSSRDTSYREWDVVNGFREFTIENFSDNKKAGNDKDLQECLMQPLIDLRSPTSTVNSQPQAIHYFAYVNPQPYLKDNAFLIEAIQQYAAILPAGNVCIILITPDITLDGIAPGTLLVANMDTPSVDELESVLVRILAGSVQQNNDVPALSDEDVRRIALLGLGLTMYEFETYAAIAITEAGLEHGAEITLDVMVAGISKGKMAVIKQSEILELYPTEAMSNVGGMARLKDWVKSRAGCYSEEAREFGIEPPKGAVLVGVPGAGKSLASKAVANELGVPLVRMDFSRIFSKYVGDSESRVRSALRMVEGMAPCVLFVDEIDKGLGGIGGGGDSGTSSRVLGSFLTWLQENTAPVFVMVTANRVDGLPPELLRRGRFDNIFSVTLPTGPERLEVLNIHLRKRGKSLKFNATDIGNFTTASNDYVPAEIESAVKDALVSAFNAGTEVKMSHIIEALRGMVPMSKSYALQINSMVKWAKDNATPVNYDESTDDTATAMPAARRIGGRASRGGN